MTGEKRVKRDISGWIVLNKPYDMTSTQAVGKVRWLLGAKKAGHAGTLDPLATGVLPVALGEATKTVPVVQDGRKVYRFTVNWGAETATDDAEGEVTERSEGRPEETAIRAALPAFTGAVMQRPPAFSAIKVDGERAYDLARAGETVELAPRPVFIEALRLLDAKRDSASFEMTCEKGTYVRALARDLARALGTRGHVGALHRAQVGPFTDAGAISIAELERTGELAVVPVAAGLVELPQVRLTASQAQVLRHGNPVLLTGAAAPVQLNMAWASEGAAVVALGYVDAGHFHPQRVLL